jgi:Beta-propeller repeat
VDAQGDLVLSTASGSLRFQKPVVYQEGDGGRHAIAGSYVRKGPHQVGFHVAAYDPVRPLVIDPVLSYATYLGGCGAETGFGIAVDATGAAYVTGQTSSPDFPTTPGALQTALGGGGSCGQRLPSDAFVAKLTTLAFAGTPWTPNCHGQSVSALARQFRNLDAAAAALGFPSVQALQHAIQAFCKG